MSKKDVQPVAWMMVNEMHDHTPSLHWKPQDWHITWQAKPLYTHPPAADVAELVEALRPFSAFDLRGDGLDSREDSQPVYARDKTVLTVGDFRRAQAALTKHGGAA